MSAQFSAKMLKDFVFKTGLEGNPFPEVKGVVKTLSEKYKDNVRCTDIIADEEASRVSKDKFIMKASFFLEKANREVDVFYGDETRIVTKVEWK